MAKVFQVQKGTSPLSDTARVAWNQALKTVKTGDNFKGDGSDSFPLELDFDPGTIDDKANRPVDTVRDQEIALFTVEGDLLSSDRHFKTLTPEAPSDGRTKVLLDNSWVNLDDYLGNFQWNFEHETAPPPSDGCFRFDRSNLVVGEYVEVYIDYDHRLGGDISIIVPSVLAGGSLRVALDNIVSRLVMIQLTEDAVDMGTYMKVVGTVLTYNNLGLDNVIFAAIEYKPPILSINEDLVNNPFGWAPQDSEMATRARAIVNNLDSKTSMFIFDENYDLVLSPTVPEDTFFIRLPNDEIMMKPPIRDVSNVTSATTYI